MFSKSKVEEGSHQEEGGRPGVPRLPGGGHGGDPLLWEAAHGLCPLQAPAGELSAVQEALPRHPHQTPLRGEQPGLPPETEEGEGGAEKGL